MESGTLKEVTWKDTIEEETMKKVTPGLRRSTRVKTPIKILMNEQSLYQEAIGPRRDGKCLKSSKDILQKEYDQKINVGSYNVI